MVPKNQHAIRLFSLNQVRQTAHAYVHHQRCHQSRCQEARASRAVWGGRPDRRHTPGRPLPTDFHCVSAPSKSSIHS
eukprot:2894935-Amphidinium_carterae.1